jgi:hypothetical protein
MAKSSLLRKLCFVLVVFGLVWAVMLLYWRDIYRVPNATDIAIYLVALPLGVILVFVGLRVGIERLKRGPATPSADVATSAVPAAANDPAQAFTLQVLASGLRLPAGNSVAELIAAVHGKKRPGLHPTLRDGRGMPVFAAEVAGIKPEAFDDIDLPEDYAEELDEAQRRALLLAADAADDVISVAVGLPKQASGALPVHLLLPERWQETSRTAAASWITAALRARNPAVEGFSVHVQVVADAAQALQCLDELNLVINRQTTTQRQIVLVCDCLLSERIAQSWGAAGRLLSSTQDNGCVLGEGACALLVQRPSRDQDDTSPHLRRLGLAQRETSADRPGRTQAEVVADAIKHAQAQLAEASLPVIGGVVSDADHRASRASEIATALESTLPELDADRQSLSLGLVNGDSGAVIALSAVALAAESAQSEQHPYLVLSVREAHARGSLLVVPSLPPVTIDGSST